MPRFLIYFKQTYSIPISRPIEEELLQRGHELKWYSEIPEYTKSLDQKRVLKSIEEAVAYQPDIVFVSANIVAHFISGIKVQIFHGFNAQKRNADDHFQIRGFFDLYCTHGPSTTGRFEELSKKHGYFKVAETGFPKVDPLFKSHKEFRKDKAHLLLSSTFSPNHSWAHNEAALNKIIELSKTGKYHMDVLMHPLMEKSIVEKIRRAQHENFVFHDTTEFTDLLLKCDLLFADTTSVIQEFLILDKPVVSYKHWTPNNYLIHVKEPEKIKEAIDYGLEKPAEIMEQIKIYTEQLHPYKDGESAARVIDASIAFLNSDRSKLRPKPLNLWRKWQNRKRLKYFKW